MALISLVASLLRLPEDSVTRETSMKTTPQWDSLKHMELILAIEDDYGLTLDGDEIATMTSVGAIEDVLSGKGLTP